MKRILTFLCILSSICLHAQTGIGTTTPNASAKLDVFSTNKGFLPPRVSLLDAYDRTTIPSPATGLLVYCKGDAGLSAGYYYWNGNAWATIATEGGSGSVAAEYGSQILSSNISIPNATPVDVVSFTLPSAGTWELIYFLRAQGAAGFAGEIAIYDANNIVVPNSEILCAYGETGSTGTGVIRVTTTGSAVYKLKAFASGGASYPFQAITDGNGRTGVTWKKISGNAPVTGQSVDYGIARYTGADVAGLSALALVGFDASAAGNLTWSGNKFTLKANKTYELESGLAIFNTTAGSAGRFQIYDYTNSIVLANSLFMSQNGAGSYGQNANTPMKCIITPTSEIQVGVRLLDYYGGAPGIVGNAVTTGIGSSPNSSYFIAKQIGSSAFVNPWVLSGNDVYNTTGKVGIGTASPNTSALLDLNSSSKGLLPPRVALLSSIDVATIASPATGLLIYNTATAGASPNNIVPGYYFYNGAKWVAMNNGGVALSLESARTISMTGDVTYTSGSFNGTANVTGTATLANSGVTAGTYGSASSIPSLTVDEKGRITAVTTNAVTGGTSNKAYYYSTNNTTYINNTYQNGYNLATSTIIPFVEATLPAFSNGFTRVDNYTIKNTSGRTINLKVETSHFIVCSNTTTSTYNPQLYFLVNGSIVSQPYSGWAFQANNYGNVMLNSTIITLNNNDTFSYKLAIAGGWNITLKNNYINLIEF